VYGNYYPPIEPTYHVLKFSSLSEVPTTKKYGTKIFVQNTMFPLQKKQYPYVEVLYSEDKIEN
jgi:hypothetical protein